MQLEQLKVQLERARIFNSTSSFNQFWNRKALSKEPKFNNVYSRNNLSKIKNGAYVISLYEFKSIGTHCIALYVNGNNASYFDSFGGVEHTLNENKNLRRSKNLITNICRTQAYNSIMCGYFCIGFIDFMLKGKSLVDYTNLFSPNEYQKNNKTMLKYFCSLKG